MRSPCKSSWTDSWSPQVGQLKPKPPSTIVVVAGQEEEEIPTKLLS